METEYRDYAKKEAERIKNEIKGGNFDTVFAFIPDLHYKCITEMRVTVGNIISVINDVNKEQKVDFAGLGGDKTPQALSRLRSDVIDRKPDAVSIFFGNNDAVIGRGEWRDEPLVSPVTFGENLQWIIHLCRLQGGIRKFSINTLTDRMEGQQYLDFGDCRGEYCLAARRTADLMNTLLVPLDAVFRDLRERNIARISPEGLLYTRDGIHMNDEGYRIIAETMLREWNLL